MIAHTYIHIHKASNEDGTYHTVSVYASKDDTIPLLFRNTHSDTQTNTTTLQSNCQSKRRKLISLDLDRSSNQFCICFGIYRGNRR